MQGDPDQKLDPRIKSVWRLSDLIWIVLCGIACVLIALMMVGISPDEDWPLIVLLAVIVVFAVLLILFMVVIPPIRFVRWSYSISPDYLEIVRGIIWRKHFIIPFIRVQNTDTKQGPIMRAFGLASVTVSTAAGAHEIPGLRADEAAQLRDRAAEFARLAREDV